MAEPTALTQHIESFVDSSRSPSLQMANLDVIVSFLKSDVLSVGTLVREMDLYLTTTDDIIRARGMLLLGEALTRLSSKPLDSSSVHSLITFFTERLADWRALRGALVGCLALIKRKNKGTVSTADAKAVAEAYLQHLQVQSLGQHDRKLCFELLECLLERHPDALSSLGEDLIYAICEAMDGEKDPECLIVTFHIVELLVQMFSDPSGPLESFISDLFSILGCYFPIHFTHPKTRDVAIERDDLSTALMHSFSSTPLFEPFVVPLLLEKLSSSLLSAKVDSLKYLSYCTPMYGADRMRKHAGSIWCSLKDALYSTGQDRVLSFTLESPDHLDFQKSEIVTEALLLLEKVIVQNNDVFVSLILGDEEIKSVFDTIASYNNYKETPSENKWKLHIVGEILYVSAKASVVSCNSVFGHFFPHLMETLGISDKDTSAVCDDNCMISIMPNYGSLLLSIELLGACRDLIKDSADLKSQHIYVKETSLRLLACFSASLSNIFCSALQTSINRSASDAHIYLGVRGLQILAMFPGGYSLVSKSTFVDILVTLKSIITSDFNKAHLWKLALKALVHIGTFIHGCNEPEKVISFMDIIVERVISLVSSNDTSMPFPLKMELISDVSTIGAKYMLKTVQGLENILFSNLPEVYIHGDLESVKIVLQLLECYSNKLLPWIQKTKDFEEFLLKFVINLWDQFEKRTAFNVQVHAKELLDATIKVMKIAVACCSVESQRIIVEKSFSVLSSGISAPLKKPLFTSSMQTETFDQGMDVYSVRDEWLYSLFASVIIALRPQTHVPKIKDILRLFVTVLLNRNVSSAQALGSMVNKLGLKSNGTDVRQDCTIDEAIDIIFHTNAFGSLANDSLERAARMSNGNQLDLADPSLGSIRSELLQCHAITGLAWIGKGLLMQGHGKVKDIVMVFLDCLSSNETTDKSPSEDQSLKEDISDQELLLKTSAADAFQILMSDSELCLSRDFHAIIRPLYKQRFFSIVMPIFQSLIIKLDPSVPSVSRLMLHRAFVHVISDTPLIVILNDAKKIIPLLLDGLNLLSKDVSNNDITYSMLLVLSGILTDKNGEVAVKENALIIITCLIGLVGYPHMMLVRETAIQCLVVMSELPQPRIYPMRIQVLQAVSKVLDDPKRVVRQQAVKCLQAWASIASRSLHF